MLSTNECTQRRSGCLMNWLTRLERKYGRFAIPKLMYYILSLNFVIFLLMMLGNGFHVVNYLTLVPSLVMQGEVWRLITFTFIPPSTSPIFILFVLYFYYLIGNSLEAEWGSFKFNVYYFSGMLATILAAFIAGGSTGVFLNLSLFLAFAFLFPNFEILIFFILPVKVKYLAILYWIIIAWTVATAPLPDKIASLASVVNFFLFFGVELIQRTRLRRQVHFNRRKFFSEIANTPPIHHCAVCGTTEKKEPRMDFAYCKDCDDEYEYCTRHITAHQHQGHYRKQ